MALVGPSRVYGGGALFYSASAGHLGSAKREKYRTPRIFETDKRTAAMIKLLLWYLLERLVSVPAQCLMCIHSKLMLKVTRALRKSKQADRERCRGNNSNKHATPPKGRG